MNMDNLPRKEDGTIDMSQLTTLQQYHVRAELEKQKAQEEIAKQQSKMEQASAEQSAKMQELYAKTKSEMGMQEFKVKEKEINVVKKEQAVDKAKEQLLKEQEKFAQMLKDVEELEIALGLSVQQPAA